MEIELEKWAKTIQQIKAWLADHKYLFCDIDSDEQLAAAERIVNAYPAYGSSQNYLGDLEVIIHAMARGLTVISLELRAQQHSRKRPKIATVCDELGSAV